MKQKSWLAFRLSHSFHMEPSEKDPISNQDLLEQMEALLQLALRDYPYPYSASDLDPNLLFVLGQIAGMANKAIAEYRAMIKQLSDK